MANRNSLTLFSLKSIDFKFMIRKDFKEKNSITQDLIFNYEFHQFIQLPKILEFVKNRIWYIVVH